MFAELDPVLRERAGMLLDDSGAPPQAKPCHLSGEAGVSRIRRNQNTPFVGPRGFEPRTCGLRVRSKGAGRGLAWPVSSVFVSVDFPTFPVVPVPSRG
jgi:hypothetical protein